MTHAPAAARLQVWERKRVSGYEDNWSMEKRRRAEGQKGIRA
jgi:hypothetical protein